MLEFPVWRNLAASRPRAAAGRGRGTHQPPRGGVDAGGVGAVGGAGEEVARTATHSSGRTGGREGLAALVPPPRRPPLREACPAVAAAASAAAAAAAAAS